MRRPSRRTWTRPTSRRTRRCLETEGCSRPRESTISPTGRSSRARKARMSRRRASAMALKASKVVAARGTGGEYIPIWEYVKSFFERGKMRSKNQVCLAVRRKGRPTRKGGRGAGPELNALAPKGRRGECVRVWRGAELERLGAAGCWRGKLPLGA